MSAYSPPTENLPVFNSLVFSSSFTSTSGITEAYLSANYLKFPTAQNAIENTKGISNTGAITNTGNITNIGNLTNTGPISNTGSFINTGSITSGSSVTSSLTYILAYGTTLPSFSNQNSIGYVTTTSPVSSFLLIFSQTSSTIASLLLTTGVWLVEVYFRYDYDANLGSGYFYDTNNPSSKQAYSPTNIQLAGGSNYFFCYATYTQRCSAFYTINYVYENNNGGSFPVTGSNGFGYLQATRMA